MANTEKEVGVQTNEGLVHDLDSFNAKLAQVREAQKVFASFSQEQVDKIFKAAAIAANKARIPLAKMAVEETGMGVAEDKVIKNHYASEYIYNKYKDTKTCGTIEYDSAFGIRKVAEPIGIIGAVIPTTNPTSTAIFKTLICLKTRNGIIISPHPRAKNSTIAAAKIVLEAAVKAGAPENIIGWIDVPSLELTNELMRNSDTILATGGPGMVKAAYSSGKPALGVGAGNTPVIIDSTADIKVAVSSIIHSKTFDNGMICASEQSVTVMSDIYDEVKKEFAYRGCYFLKDEELEKVRKTIIINGALNAKIVGQKAHTIAALAGVEVPESTKILIGEVESVDISEEFAHEKLSPVLAMYKAETFDEAIAKAIEIGDMTDGALDITVYPLVREWGFTTGDSETEPSYKIPEQWLIDWHLGNVGYDKIVINDSIVTLPTQFEIDLGSIAKGYATDAVNEILEENHISSALINLGGNVYALGRKPDKSKWKVGIQNPKDTNKTICTLAIENKAVITSGNYERYFEVDGKRYCHIIDPKTGYPVQHNILSATVLADNCATADAYATSFMVLGMEGTRRILDKHPELMAYFIYSGADGSYQVWYSPSLRDKILED